MPNLAGRAGARKAAEHGARTVAGARYKARQDRQDSAATERRMKQFQARQEAARARRRGTTARFLESSGRRGEDTVERDGRSCWDRCKCWRVAGPEAALIKTGFGTSQADVRTGDCVCVWPCCQWVDKIECTCISIQIESRQVLTLLGVEVSLDGMVQVRIDPDYTPAPEPEPTGPPQFLRMGSDQRITGMRPPPPRGAEWAPQKEPAWSPLRSSRDDVVPFSAIDEAGGGKKTKKQAQRPHDPHIMLRRAAAHFGGWSKGQITALIKETLQGHQRAVLAEMTVEQLISHRSLVERRFREVVTADLSKVGIKLMSYTILSITDDNGVRVSSPLAAQPNRRPENDLFVRSISMLWARGPSLRCSETRALPRRRTSARGTSPPRSTPRSSPRPSGPPRWTRPWPRASTTCSWTASTAR